MLKKLKIDKNYLIFIAIYIFILIPIVLLHFPDIRNEIKYFVITDNIINSKNFLVLKYFSDLYPDKPPFYFLILYFIKKYFSNFFTQEAIICGSLIPSFFITIFFYKFVKNFKNRKIAFVFTLFLLSIPFFIGTSVFMRMDMLMTCFIFFSLYFFFNIYYEKMKFNNINIFAIYIFIFLAVFTKGPAGFIIPIGVIISFLILEKNIKFLKKIKFIRGLILIILLIGTWIFLVLQQPQGKEYVSLLFGQETVGRIVKSKAHVRPFYYYIENIPVMIYPYGVALLMAIIFYIKNIKKYSNWDILEKIGFVWTVIPIIILSCASGKLEIYLLPTFIGMAIIFSNFFIRNKNTKSGKIIIKFTEICSIFALPFNLIFNKKKNFYKRMILIPISIFTIFFLIIPCIEIYNKNFSLKYVVKILSQYQDKKIIAYKFTDMINLTNEVNKEIITINNINSEILKNSDIKIIISRKKYSDDLDNQNLNIIYENRVYFIFMKN